MFKRANKITSLLIAAASVMSLVPAYAADVTKVDSQDGTVYNAVAYKDGKFFVDGEINDNEDDYYVSDGKFNALDDVDSGDEAALYGEKYLDMSDGDYTVDLSSGTVTDDDVKGDSIDDAATSLRKEIKDDTEDRYSKAVTNVVKLDNDMNLVPGGKYAAPWYYTSYTNADKDANLLFASTASGTLNVFTDTKGNYIDADYNVGKIKVTTTAAGVSGSKEDTVENTNDKYDTAAGDDTLKVSVTGQKVLSQDKDYIYRLVTVNVAATGANITKINGVDITKIGSSTVFTGANGSSVTYKAVQKISKAQASGEVDNAKYAKTVTTYALSDEDGKVLGGDALFNTYTNTQFTVVDGKLIAYNYVDNGMDNKKVTVRAYSLKTSGGYYYMDEEDESKEDAEKSAKHDNAAVQTDVDGNLWRLDGGYIYKFDNKDDWDKVYKVDGAFDEFEVYDKDNIAAWSEDDEVYSLIGGKTADKEDENKGTDTKDNGTTPAGQTTVPATKDGWEQTSAGWVYNEAGTQVKGWKLVGSTWYFMNANGIMATGWAQPGGAGTTWYYLNESGAMATGWTQVGGTWYYFDASGAMLADTTTPDGYYVNASGAWV